MKNIRNKIINEIICADRFLEWPEIGGVFSHDGKHSVRDYRIREGSQVVFEIEQKNKTKLEYERCHREALIFYDEFLAGIRADRLLSLFNIEEK